MIHQGPMDTVGATYQRLATWIEENGYRSTGVAREVYLALRGGRPARAG